jgi:uncharacterized protein YegJ (DUF2314 family)
MVKVLLGTTLFVVCLLFTASCNPSAPTPTSVSAFTDPDPELEEAARQAQNTLHVFRQAFLAPKAAYELMSLKIRFRGDDGSTEDMWTEPMFILDDVYTVRMVEGVTLEQGIHPERLLDVELQDIVDWMILQKDGRLIGGYTLRLEYERMTPEEQQKYLEITGYKFE